MDKDFLTVAVALIIRMIFEIFALECLTCLLCWAFEIQFNWTYAIALYITVAVIQIFGRR